MQEWQAQQSSAQQSIPSKAQANMLRISRATSDSDEEPDISRAFCVRARTESNGNIGKVVLVHKISEETDGVHLQKASQVQIKYNSPELESGKFCVVPFGTLAKHRCKIVWNDDQAAKEPNVGYTYIPMQGEQAMSDDLPELEDDSDDDVDQPMKFSCQDVPYQLGSRPEVVKDGDLVVFRKHLGRCVVVDDMMMPLCAYLREQLRKPSREIQEKAAFESLTVSYDPDTHSATLQSLACDSILENI